MDIDEEFDALGLPAAKEQFAWEARAKITWGEAPDQVHTWLLANGLQRRMADRIVAIAVSERAIAIRAKGIRDLVLGLFGGAAAASIGIGAFIAMRDGFQGVRLPTKGLAAIAAVSFVGFMFSLNVTWRGAERLIGGARVKGDLSESDD